MLIKFVWRMTSKTIKKSPDNLSRLSNLNFSSDYLVYVCAFSSD